MTGFNEIYISVDIEATGPIPGLYSMSSIGAFTAGARTCDGTFVHFDHTETNNVFYAELQPISEHYIPDAINVGILDGFDNSRPDMDGSRHFQWMKEHGDDPADVMSGFVTWVIEQEKHYKAPSVFMAYPASFDWTFVYWYMIRFGVESPFGFSRVLDLKTLFAAKSHKPIRKSIKRYMPKSLFPKLLHTHRADDDAIEQGVLGINLLQWDGKQPS
jgi:hypothetical protein